MFGTDAEAGRWADEWVVANSLATSSLHLQAAEQAHIETFLFEYGRLRAQFDVEYEALVGLVDQVNFIDRSTWPPVRSIQYVLLAYNLKPFASAMDRLARGYYEDAITLTRVLYETFLRLIFVSCHPDDPWGALARGAPKGTPAFNVTNFVRDNLRLGWETNYGIMSLFAHSNAHQASLALQRAQDRVGRPERFGLRIAFDARLAELSGVFLQFMLLGYLRWIVERFVGKPQTRSPVGLRRATEAIGLLDYGFRNSPKAHWRAVAVDLDFIFELVEVADRGDDWRAFVRSSRPPIQAKPQP